MIKLTFTPGALGARTATLSVADDAPASPQQSTLNGTGVVPNVSLGPNPFDFLNQKVAVTSAVQTITVTNSGTQASTLAAVNPVTLTGTNAGDFAIVGGTTTCVANFVLTASGGSCVIKVTFTPGALGARTATLNVADDAPGTPQQSVLNGTGVLANVTVLPNPVPFGSVALTITSAPSTITVTNAGTLAATLAAVNPVTITGANAPDFAIVGGTTTCVANFVLTASGGSCVINVTFHPGALGLRGATVNVFDDAPASPQQTALSGTGVQSAITLNPSPVNFNNQKVATTSATTRVTVTNTGGLAATLGAGTPVTIIGANPGDFAIVPGTTTCVANFVLVASTGSCVIDITFTPSVINARTATLNIVDTDPNSPQQAALNGTGVLANITVTPTPTVVFAARILSTTSAPLTVTVTNTGTLAATLSAVTPITFTGANPGDFAIVGGTTTCVANFVLNANGGSCVVNVTFTPAASGARAATLNVADDAPASPQTTSLTGTGQTAPTADLSTLNIPFGNKRVGTSTASTVVTMTNNGQANLIYASIVPGGTDSLQYALIAGGGAGPACTLAGGVILGGTGASCTFSVTFSPTSTGAKSAKVTISHNGNSTGTPGTLTDVTLTGTGIQASLTLAPNPANFNNVKVGTASAPLAITLTNSGTDTATLAGANAVTVTGANAADFVPAAGTTCTNGLVLTASPGLGNTCVINIILTPGALGARTATVNVADNAPGTPQTATLNGTGVLANLTLVPSPLSFNGVNLGSNSTLGITVTNTGTLAATLGAGTPVTITGGQAGDFSTVAGTTCVANFALNANGGSCVINVRFTPGALGARAAQVNIADDAPGNPHAVPLTGTGTVPGFSLSSGSVPDFGSVQVGVTQAATGAGIINLTNTGTGPLTITSITVVAGSNPNPSAGDFSRTTTCPLAPATLAPSGICTITAAMNPQTGSVGPKTAAISIVHDAAGSPGTITLSGTAVDFSLISTSTPAAVTAGGTEMYTLNFHTTNGSSLSPTTFACSGLPRKTTCVFTPPSIPAGSPDTPVTLAIVTTSNTVTVSTAGVAGPMIPTGGGLPPGAWPTIAMGVLGLFGLATWRKQALRLSAARLCLLALVLVAGGYLAGCASGGSGFPEGASGTPPGSYTVTVAATSGSVQRTTNVTLNVQ